MDDAASGNAQAHIARLMALADRQLTEITQLRAEATAQAVIDVARGVLMERLGCSAAESGVQLDRIAAEARSTPADLAAQIVGVPAFGTSPTEGEPALPSAPRLAAALAERQPDAASLASALLEDALAGTGAVAVAIWLVAPDGALDMAGQAGFPATEASGWRRVPPGVDVLPARALRGQSADDGVTWWPAGRPDADHISVPGPWRSGGRAVLPIRRAGSPVGAVEVCWPEPVGEFSKPLRRQLLSIADLCGQALWLSQPGDGPGAGDAGQLILGVVEGLADSVLYAQAVRDDNGDIADFRLTHLSPDFADPAGRARPDLIGASLLGVYPGAALPGGLFDAAVQVLRTGAPRHMSDEVIAAQSAGRVTARITRLFDGVLMTLRPASEPERLAVLLSHAERLGRIGGWEEVLATGEVYWTQPAFELFSVSVPVGLSELHRHVPAEDAPAVLAFRRRLLQEKTGAAAAFRITRTGDSSVRHIRAFAEPVLDATGQPVAVHGAYQDVSTRYHTEVALAVTRDQLSETEQRAEEEHLLAIRLQEAITPHSSRLLEAGDLVAAARYRPAGEVHLVGGDWYDAVPLPTGQVLLVVGDVAGHGIDAVTGMVALRYSLRGLAVTGPEPPRLLALLNNVCTELAEGVLGTAVCAVYDPPTRTLRWARAGHLPIIRVRAGRAQRLEQPKGLLLGASADEEYGEATATLEAGDTLLMYTDGLIERRGMPIDDCLETLVGIASRPVGDIDAFSDLVAAEAASDTGDDACLLVVTVR